MKQLSYIWNKISNIGISDEVNDRVEIKIRVFNQSLILLGVTSIMLIIIELLLHGVQQNLFLRLLQLAIPLIILFINYKRRFSLSRIIGFIVYISFLVYSIYLEGITSGESLLFLLLILTLLIQFEGQNKYTLFYSVISLLLICIAVYLHSVYSSDSANIEFVYRSTFVTIMGSAVAGLLIVFYQNEIQNISKQKDNLVIRLKQNNQELEQLNTELDEFTYIASHDLKSPIRNVISFTDLLERDLKNGKSDSTLKYLSFIKTSAKQMNSLVTDVLEYSELHNDTDTNKNLVNLNEVVDSVKLSLHQEIHEKGAQITSSHLPNYLCNETQIKILFQNLIQNGIKYNKSELVQINIWSDIKEKFVVLYFKDNGIGIEEQYFDTIFEFFKRLHTKDEHEGTGIGLGLCMKIVNKMEGTISVQSKIGEGTTFMIQLPIQD